MFYAEKVPPKVTPYPPLFVPIFTNLHQVLCPNIAANFILFDANKLQLCPTFLQLLLKLLATFLQVLLK